MKLLVLLGTRPEAIKTAPVVVEARRRAAEGIETRVVSTGQHREMVRTVARLFGTQPDIDLDLMEPNQTLASLTARAMVGLTQVYERERPDAVLVQGDTTTAMCGALAAFYLRIPVGHIEAGLRTGDVYSPFPEEANRRIVSQFARWHFAPTEGARANLLRENLPEGSEIVVTGNTVIDALLLATERVRAHPSTDEHVAHARAWKARGGRVVLVTGHRRENFGAPFESFCRGLLDIADAFPDALVLYPVHLNPNVQEPVRRLMGGRANVRLAPPADYPEFVELMTLADLIVTDSGGVQEEAPSLGVPVLVTRTTTERPEAVEAGAVLLVGPDRERIAAEAKRLLSDPAARAKMRIAANPYGDGHAAKRIVDALVESSRRR